MCYKVGENVHFKNSTYIPRIGRLVEKEEILIVKKISLIKGTLYELELQDGKTCIAFENELERVIDYVKLDTLIQSRTESNIQKQRF